MFLWHSMGCRHECWSMHQESPSGNNSNRPLFLMSNFCQPRIMCSLIFRICRGFVAPEFVHSDFPRHGIPPPPPGTSPVDGVYPKNCNCCIKLYPKLQKCVSRVYPNIQECVSHVRPTPFSFCSATAAWLVPSPVLLFPGMIQQLSLKLHLTAPHTQDDGSSSASSFPA